MAPTFTKFTGLLDDIKGYIPVKVWEILTKGFWVGKEGRKSIWPSSISPALGEMGRWIFFLQ